MLSYQHAYHAGSLADVHKHVALSVLLEHMTLKDKLNTYMETHAGRGVYDLSSLESLVTGEAKSGILQYLESEVLHETPFSLVLQKIQRELGKRFYPGSPYVASSILNTRDEIHLMELHPEEYFHLSHSFHEKNVHIHHRNGYEGVLAISPPKARRGVVFIDPSYEQKSEYKTVVDFVAKIHKKWAEATILIWYPILEANNHKKIASALYGNRYPKMWSHEMLFNNPELRIQGSGLIGINMPYGVDEKLAILDKL